MVILLNRRNPIEAPMKADTVLAETSPNPPAPLAFRNPRRKKLDQAEAAALQKEVFGPVDENPSICRLNAAKIGWLK